MNELSAIKMSRELFMDIPAETIEHWKKVINHIEPYERYKIIIEIYQQGFVDAIKELKEFEKCQKNLKQAKKLHQENS